MRAKAATILLGVISFDPAFFMGRQLLLIRPGVRRSGSSAEFVYQTEDLQTGGQTGPIGAFYPPVAEVSNQ